MPAFNWAVKQGYVKANYFSGKITLANKDDIASAKQPFLADEMKLLGPKLLGWSFLEHNTVKGRFGRGQYLLQTTGYQHSLLHWY